MTIAEVRQIVRELDDALGRLRQRRTADVRAVRRELSAKLKARDAGLVDAIADALLKRDEGFDRFIAYELIANHRDATKGLTAARLNAIGQGMDCWEDVDTFGCYLSGVAWREGQISDKAIEAWSRSKDRWWRRAALVSTVPLNLTARGGRGDTKRTLAACDWLIDDRDPMVVKALSWALRSLVPRDADAVRAYLEQRADRLPALALRETRTKLATGLKNPGKGGKRGQSR